MTCEFSRNTKGSQCFKCQGYVYIAAQYPRNFLIKKTDDEIETVVYKPTGSTIDSDDDVGISSIQLGIVRCSHIAVKDED